MAEKENPISEEDSKNELSGSESDPDADTKMSTLKNHPPKAYTLVVSKLPKNFTKKVCLLISNLIVYNFLKMFILSTELWEPVHYQECEGSKSKDDAK